MKQIYVIYDDSKMPGKEIKTITGEKSYGETIFKRVTLKDRMYAEIGKEKQVVSVFYYKDAQDANDLFTSLPAEKDVTIIHLYSSFGLKDTNAFSVLLKKAPYMNEAYTAYCDGKPAMTFVDGAENYQKVFSSLIQGEYEGEKIETDAFMDLSVRANFLTFITGGFDARFFNALAGDEYTVTKRSTKKEKIKAEYEFYYLLPEDMKMWFVMPYNYTENSEGAAYTMERFHMTDIAIRFVHGAVDEEELKDILDKLFYFIKLRKTKSVSGDAGKKIADELYIDKLNARMEELKKYDAYEQFNTMIRMGTKYESIEDIVSKYQSLYQKMATSDNRNFDKLAVGHGDLCFSNILYSKEAEVLKLIDPKGAVKEEDLYTDPYYDLAKLSHSICGCYDFFNSGLYDISIRRDLSLNLIVDADNTAYKEIFKSYLKENGYQYALVRLYEASLFLSMLPYHMDQPGKVFGFLLNAINILEEVEKCTRD